VKHDVADFTTDFSWLRAPPLSDLLAVLNHAGEEARVVGGAVRNALLNLPHGDIDIATTAPPQEVMRRAEAAGFKSVPTGIDHGTVTIVIAGQPFEVTTLREDVETFGRHATVEFGRDWKRDAERRDFTMNALSLTADGAVHDYVGGRADIAARHVRFIGDAAARIAEDYLRILRFFRFHAYYGEGHPDAAGLHAAIVARAGLEQLSRERIRMELMKLLIAPRAVPALVVMAEAGLIGPVLGGVPYLANFANMAKVEAACGLAPDATRRLGALGAWVTENAELMWQRLRLSNAEHARLAAMAQAWWRVSPQIGEAGARELIYRIGAEHFTDRVLLAWSRADASAHDAAWRDLAMLPQRWSAPAFPIRAADFVARGVEKGPPLGAALARAEQAWIEAGFPTERKALNEIVNEALGG
jgi:tRNA nucleotidyltransferase/poly(A) polymerase